MKLTVIRVILMILQVFFYVLIFLTVAALVRADIKAAIVGGLLIAATRGLIVFVIKKMGPKQ